jgi:peptidylprolyl isomerase
MPWLLIRVEGMADKTKPEIDFIEGPAPTDLVITDLEVGDGPEAAPGATVDVHYVGVDYETGEQFDASWDRGSSIQFPLAGLIKGWQDGIPGMRVGGRRQLVVPPEQAYGAAGSGHRLGGRTLVFVIDLLNVR